MTGLATSIQLSGAPPVDDVPGDVLPLGVPAHHGHQVRAFVRRSFGPRRLGPLVGIHQAVPHSWLREEMGLEGTVAEPIVVEVATLVSRSTTQSPAPDVPSATSRPRSHEFGTSRAHGNYNCPPGRLGIGPARGGRPVTWCRSA